MKTSTRLLVFTSALAAVFASVSAIAAPMITNLRREGMGVVGGRS